MTLFEVAQTLLDVDMDVHKIIRQVAGGGIRARKFEHRFKITPSD
jgi:hypothetical protein